MGIVFFEGFNYNDSDIKKLDTNYWSIASNDSYFTSARTGNGIYIKSSPLASGLSFNKKLDLNNFNSPLASGNAFGIGFWVADIAPSSNLISVYNGALEVLDIDIVKTTHNGSDSIGLSVSQNGSLTTTYDFKSALGYTYGFGVSYYSDPATPFLSSAVYLEFYTDSKSSNTFRVRANGLDLLNASSSTNTAITGFSNIDKITLYGPHDRGVNNSTSFTRGYDDFYLSYGNNINDTLLGVDTKVHRLLPDGTGDSIDWSNTYAYSSLWSNDGDNSYIYSQNPNDTSTYVISNLPNLPNGTSVGGIRLFNTARKVSQNGSFVNVFASGTGGQIIDIGQPYSLTANSYDYYNSFVFKNPQNSGDWTVSDINNMHIGVKNTTSNI